MSDIVERLRGRKLFWLNGSVWMMGTEPDRDCAEAADVIMLLRRLLDDRETDLHRMWGETNVEIERLTKECEEQARLNGMGAERELALRAEIERLRVAPIQAIKAHPGLTDDEKRIAIAAIRCTAIGDMVAHAQRNNLP
jgi:hypothetical protein